MPETGWYALFPGQLQRLVRRQTRQLLATSRDFAQPDPPNADQDQGGGGGRKEACQRRRSVEVPNKLDHGLGREAESDEEHDEWKALPSQASTFSLMLPNELKLVLAHYCRLLCRPFCQPPWLT